MEQDQTQLDAVLGALDFDAIAGVPSEPAVDAESQDVAPSEEAAVAPPESGDSTESAVDASAPAGDAAPTPSAPETPAPLNYDSDENPYLAEVKQYRELIAEAQRRAQEQQAQQQREAQEAAWQERIAALEDLPPDMRALESRRLVAEIEAERVREAQTVIAARETDAEQSAKAFAAFFNTVKETLPPEQFAQIEANARHLLQFNSPDAMQAQLARDNAIRAESKAQIEALQKQLAEAQLAQQAKERIASGADRVGTGVGTPATNGTATRLDQTLDALFATM